MVEARASRVPSRVSKLFNLPYCLLPNQAAQATRMPSSQSLNVTGISVMNEKDLRIDVYRPGREGWGSCYMRITHMPTGIVVSGEGISQIRLREKLLNELREVLGGESP